ncbi:MAG TPA: Ig-like domain-containing protein, partial [Ilumatobacteraceae bacterium]
MLARAFKLFVLLSPIVVSVGFVAFASRLVHRPTQWYGVVAWWIGLTLASTVVLAATERVMRKVLPLVALFNLSLVFPDHAPSRFKVAMRTNTLRQLQRSLEAGELDDDDFQQAAERLVALAGALNAHDRMTRGHTERVRAYTLMIGEELHLPKADLDRLHWAGLVHDVGKLEVPPSILNKAGRPDDDEWAVLKQHPAAAIRLLEPLRPWLGEWADAASQHHERWDGKGYPFGLAGEQISLSGRIVAVADAFDVMTSVRSYKKAMTPEAARAELLRCAGTQFDANVVRAFLNISVGKLRIVMGPLSWLAQAPALGNVPIGTAAITAASSLVSVGMAVAAGLAGGNDPTPALTRTQAPVFADAPVAQPLTMQGLEDQPMRIDVPSPTDHLPTSVTVTSVPDHFRIDPTSPSVLVPEANWFGRSTGEYQACWNESCSSARMDLEVQSVNDVPIAAQDGATTPEGVRVTIDVLANDIDVEDGRPVIVGVDAQSSPAGGTATLTAEGMVLFQPDQNFAGTVRLSYEVADSDGAVAHGTVTVDVTPVNSPPHAVDDHATTHAGMIAAIDVLANDVDDEHEPLTIVSVTPPAIGEVVLSANSVTFQSPTDSHGDTTFTYTIEDSHGGRGQATVNVAIVASDPPPPPTTSAPTPTTSTPPTPTSTPPAAAPIPAPTARPDQATIIEDSAFIDIDVLANDTSGDGDLTNDSVHIVGPAAIGTADVVGQWLRYQPLPNFNGIDTVTYQLCEANNACQTTTATVTVTPRNDAPTFLDSGPINVTEDSGPNSTAAWVNTISAGPPNESAQNVGFTVTVDRPTMFATLPAIDAAGTLTFTPAADANGIAAITVTAVDDAGTANGGQDTSNAHTTTITVVPVNDRPQFIDGGNISVNEDNGPATIGGWAHSIVLGPIDEQVQTIAFTVTSGQPALFSSQPAIDPTGTLTFTPAPNANGSTTVTITATDSGGTNDGGVNASSVHTAILTITPVNDPVIAVADTGIVNEDDPTGVTVNALANDTDADHDPISLVSIDTTGIVGGTVSNLGAGSINYIPDPNFNGTDTFVYTVTDGNGSTDIATVTITVTPIPDAPVATADAFSTGEDTARVVPAPGLLGNDYDEDGDSLSITPSPIAGPSNGTLILGTDGAFTYTPNVGFVGTDAFTYELNDSTGLTATTTVTITIDSGLSTGGLYLGNTSTLGTWNMTVAPPGNATPEPDFDLDGNPGITVAKDGALSTKTWIRNISGSPLALNGPFTVELWSTIEAFRPNAAGHPDITLFDCNTLGLACVTLDHTSVHMPSYNGGVADWVKVDVSLANITHTFAVGRQLRVQVKEGHNDLWIATSAARPSRLIYTIANTAPVAANDFATMLEDSGTTNINVLANDTDSNLDATTVTITTPAAKGTAVPLVDGTINYQPNADANGADSFAYQVCDTGGLCDTATVTINIT